eukprot:1702869-Ditylum_brightwellii.AAC.1
MEAILDIAAFFTELAAQCYGLVTCQQTKIVLASFLNAMGIHSLLCSNDQDNNDSNTVPLLYQQAL